jgi:iron complex outermembrane recepter protein
MLKRFYLMCLVLLVMIMQAKSQETDTTKHLGEVIIQGFLNRQPLQQIPASVALLDQKMLQSSSQQSLLPALNTLPGVRMEERSPGSYRLSIRGSLLRSPFGVRNTKVYINDMPFTDASGNAYVNLIDPVLIQRVEILKGPDGSLFGANSGGVVLFDTHVLTDTTRVDAGISGGSFGLAKQHVRLNHRGKRMQWSLAEAFQRADGYREQSAMKRLNLLANGRMVYGEENTLKITMLYADMHYETPGGLTQAQNATDPTQARPPTGMAPGAVEQHAGIYNKTFFAGVSNDWRISKAFRHVMQGFGTVTDFENPFITNYEIRAERNVGLRSFIEYATGNETIHLRWHTGIEAQWGKQSFRNYENIGGDRGMLENSDRIDLRQHFYFTRVRLAIGDRVTAEIATSFNRQQYQINTVRRKLADEWMPRIAISYRLVDPLVLRLSASKGYSPPALAELRPSGAAINQALQAEWGWSYEAGTRIQAWRGRLQFDASVFRYNLQQAITRRTSEDDTEYFVNAGGTKQAGVEMLVNATLMPTRQHGFIRSLTWQSSYTHSKFLFDQYQVDGNDYSGKRLTGVPTQTIVLAFSVTFPHTVYLYSQLLTISRTPLNDGNTAFADGYELLQAKLGWKGLHLKNIAMDFFVGTDNLLNQSYSLGNDINAFGGRYYNAAPSINFYGGMQIKLY